MSNYQQSMRGSGVVNGGGGGGVGEAYPVTALDQLDYTGEMSAYDDNVMNILHERQQHQGQQYHEDQYQQQQENQQQQYQQQQEYHESGDPDQSSVSTPRTAGGGLTQRRPSTASYASDYSQGSHAHSRSIYDDAQTQSTSRTGSILYSSGASSSRRSQQLSHNQSMLSSSLRNSSVNSSFTSGATGPGLNQQYLQQPTRSVSQSGNLLVRVQIPEEPELELDKDEIRELANSAKTTEELEAEAAFQALSENDTSTIGTTISFSNPQHNGTNQFVVSGDPLNNAIYPQNEGPLSEVEAQREKMKKLIFSPPFRRSLFVGICFVLLGLGMLLTMENFMRVKSAQDWIEPNRERFRAVVDGGDDWTFGDDAPKPIAGAAIEYSLEYNVADWAHGTSMVPATASVDCYGSVALSETVMFKDVPFFWGLPFAGGSIMESVIGQCLNLVQASNGKGMVDGRGEELRLSSVMIVGKKYLNVDLSNQEGIDRASALALGTSGMCDVAHSPLLHEMSELFTTMNQGRLFIMVRHPVEREFARLRWLRKWDHGRLLPEEDMSMSYRDFAHSEYVADNWMTRTLVRKGKDEELNAQDMHTAKEILRRKALVGLYSDMIGAARHYSRYFGWDGAMNGGKLNQSMLSCFENAILEGMTKDVSNTLDLVEADAKEGSAPWRTISEKNRFDLELYMYAQQLYKFQIAMS